MNIKELIAKMSLEEKASLCSGCGAWFTQEIERLNIPRIMLCDGPHGLRKQDLNKENYNQNDSIKAVCFPTSCASTASFDVNLLKEMGEALGDSCQNESVAIILGPAINMKRSPLCGRNFEYSSEDPYLAGKLASALVQGIQSKDVAACVKHFAANNQEHRRLSSDSRIDERTLREIYLSAFEMTVKEGKTKTIMCSYNKLNGTLASENKELLNDILRDQWGFDGLVMSDWGAVSDRVKGVAAGLDLEMPSSGGVNDKRIVEAVKSGKLSEEYVNKAAERVLKLVYDFKAKEKPNTPWDKEAQHELARKIAAESMVLLKNDEHVLPISKTDNIAVIGEFAVKPRFQGGGSSHINSFKVTSLMDMLKGHENISYSQGYNTVADENDFSLIDAAVEKAKQAKYAVIVAGLPDVFECEGYDRSHINIPKNQDELIRRVAKVNPNTIVVLCNGSPIAMPWINEVKAVIEAYLGGQAVGAAMADVLFGDVNPSGRLPESFPLKLEDNPSYLFYMGEKNSVEYREGVFIGYRYYDKKKMDVLFPFGYGLSYTDFEYSDLVLDKAEMLDTDCLNISVKVKNIGTRKGNEVVQLYVSPAFTGDVIRPIRELKGFCKLELKPNEEKTVNFKLNKRSFAYWNIDIHDWVVEGGLYNIEIAKSSRNIVLEKSVNLISTSDLPFNVDVNTILAELMNNIKTREIILPYYKKAKAMVSPEEERSEAASSAITDEMNKAMLGYMPLRNFVSFGNGAFSHEDIDRLIDELNNAMK